MILRVASCTPDLVRGHSGRGGEPKRGMALEGYDDGPQLVRLGLRLGQYHQTVGSELMIRMPGTCGAAGTSSKLTESTT